LADGVASESRRLRAATERAPPALGQTFLLHFGYLFYNIEPMKKHRFGSLELTVLNAVARLGEEAYGLGVRRDVSELLGHDYSVGAIYTTLARLEQQGLLRSSTTAPLPVRGGRSRRQFRLSPAGRQALREGERLAVRMLDLRKARPA
jgi:PadR family transcriptional regulator, regulatory protein PadR